MAKIYVASSWRNRWQPHAVGFFREAGHEVYDFRNPLWPEKTGEGFSWSEIDPNWRNWTEAQYLEIVTTHPRAREGFERDMAALRACDACVLVLPCGRSAHLELGWAVGAGRKTIVVLDRDQFEPDLMYLMCDAIVLGFKEACDALQAWGMGGGK